MNRACSMHCFQLRHILNNASSGKEVARPNNRAVLVWHWPYTGVVLSYYNAWRWRQCVAVGSVYTMWRIILCGPLLAWQCSVRLLWTIPELIIRWTVRDGGSSVSVVNRQRKERLGDGVKFPASGRVFLSTNAFGPAVGPALTSV